MPGSFLQQVAQAMSETTVITQVNALSVLYSITGTITGNIVSNAIVQVSSTPPTTPQMSNVKLVKSESEVAELA